MKLTKKMMSVLKAGSESEAKKLAMILKPIATQVNGSVEVYQVQLLEIDGAYPGDWVVKVWITVPTSEGWKKLGYKVVKV